MRMSRDATARRHDEIITAASQMLRQRGIEGLSVVDLMQSVGLTHGGFYKHFNSKEALVAEATSATFNVICGEFSNVAKDQGSAAALKAYVKYYLSADHVNTPELGCPIPAFAGEMSRAGRAVKSAFAKGYEPMLVNIAAGLACPPEKRRLRAIELLALMSGAILAARASNNPEQVVEVLSAARARAELVVNAIE